MTTASSSAEISYQGPGFATESWGFTQANFQVSQSGLPAKECAIFLNDPAAKLLAQELGVEDTPEHREALARAVGEAWIPHLAAEGDSIESLITVSVAFLNERPALMESIKRSMA